MARNQGKSKSERKPFRDISNRRIGSSKPIKKNKAGSDPDDRIESGVALDRLLLVHSEISNLLHQIDELVVQVVKAEETNGQGRKEVMSFTRVLSEMMSSLQPWVPRLQKAFSVPSMESEKQSGQCLVRGILKTVNKGDDHAVHSPEPTKVESLVSPSPLVSWRATDCAVDMGKQLFALTPLPRPKTAIAKAQALSKPVASERFTYSSTAVVPSCFAYAENAANDKLEGLLKKPTTEESPAHVAKKMKTTFGVDRSSPKNLNRDSSIILATPCLKMSSIKPCRLLDEPSCGFSYRNFDKVRKSTPFPVGKQRLNELLDFESSGCEISESMNLKCSSFSGIENKLFDASPAWFMSPPKTCILMDPSDDKPLKVDVLADEFEVLAGAFKQQISIASTRQDHAQDTCKQSYKSKSKPMTYGSNLALIESTPMWKDPQSTAYKGKRPGENTLKRELWVRFEAASTNGLNLNFTIPKETDRKGFLDMLEEAS